MVFVETSFPRGGIPKNTPAEKQQQIEFGASVTKHKKEKLNKKQREEKRRLENAVDADEKVEAISAELLSFRTLTEGIIVMGCITDVQPTNVIVSLPGRLNGQVLVTAISTAYRNILNEYVNDAENIQHYKSIEEMFDIGQIVCVKVVSAVADEHGKYQIQLSMCPGDIQSDFNHKSIQNGLIMTVAINGIEEHGYTLETGVKDLRCFMPFAQAPSGLGIGEVIFAEVEKAKISSAASTASFRFLESGDRRLKISGSEINLSHILPSTVVQFTVTAIHKDGLQGTIMDGTYTAYINEHQLQTPLAQPNEYEIDSVHDARVLYVMPITKLVYLSLNLDKIKINLSEPKIRIGDIFANAKVLRIGTGGVILQLNETAKGLVSMKSIRQGHTANFDSDEILAKYHRQSMHRVRVVSYDPMDMTYICSVNEKLINEKYFSVNDVQIGDYVEAKIQKRLDNGDYFIQVGNIRGYMERIQLSQTTAPAKLVKNAKLRCRVLRINAKYNKIFLTNRKEFMSKTVALLKSIDNAVVGLEYHGMITKINRDSYIINFCNYISGILYKSTLDSVSGHTANFFFEGQIMKFRVTSISADNRITLGLAEFKCQAGTVLQGTISTIQPSGLHVAFPNTKFNGFVPTMFLSAFPSLAQLVQETYQPNDAIDAVCITQNVYSVKDAVNFKETPVKGWPEVKLGDVVPAFVKNVSGEIIDLLCLIENNAKMLKIHAKMLLEDYSKVTNINLIAEQLLYVRILGKNNTLGTLTCSGKLSDIWHGDLKQTADIFAQYFRDLRKIENCKKLAFTQLTAGTITQGTIESVEANGAFVKLATKERAILTVPNLSKNHPVPGQQIECMVIWIDYANKLIYVTMKKKYVDRMKTKDYSNVTARQMKSAPGIKSDIILILDDLIVAYPRKLTNQFVYIPTRFHYNDLQPCISMDINEGDTIVVSIIANAEDRYIGMFQTICESFKRLHADASADPAAVAPVMTAAKPGEKRKVIVEHLADAADEKRIRLNDDNSDMVSVVEVEQKHKHKHKHKHNKMLLGDGNNVANILNNAIAANNSNNNNNNNSENKIDIQQQQMAQFSLAHAQLDGTYSDDDDDDDDDEFDSNNSKNNTDKFKNSVPKALFPDKKKKLKNTKQQQQQTPVATAAALPGIRNFWNPELNATKKTIKRKRIVTETDDKNAEPKKHLTPEERFQIARDEEARISKIEQDRIIGSGDSGCGGKDDFERKLLASPNDSAAWIQFMVFYLQTNDVDTARDVARQALKKISFREEHELLNVWIALLNLELRFNTMDAFETVFKEAALVNDSFKIYGKCLQMLADMKKIPELISMNGTFLKKFRTNVECWPIAATAYFEVGLMEKAKGLLQKALAALPERDHINTIVKFANLNNKYDNKNTAHALLEQIVTSYPKRVDCWSQYVDMLVKDKEIDLARQILDRAVVQKIPMKKMRTIFKKYLDFEQKYGNASDVKKVKEMAANYVENEIKS